jgi:hypothetical protein
LGGEAGPHLHPMPILRIPWAVSLFSRTSSWI